MYTRWLNPSDLIYSLHDLDINVKYGRYCRGGRGPLVSIHMSILPDQEEEEDEEEVSKKSTATFFGVRFLWLTSNHKALTHYPILLAELVTPHHVWLDTFMYTPSSQVIKNTLNTGGQNLVTN